VPVGRRELQQGHVQRDPAGREQARDLRQEDREEVGTAVGDRLAERRADEERHRAEPAGGLRRGERRRP
jgi:hypothetical protein